MKLLEDFVWAWWDGALVALKKKITRENLDSSVFAEIKLELSGLIHRLHFTSTNSCVAVQITEDAEFTFFSHPTICSFISEGLFRASHDSRAEVPGSIGIQSKGEARSGFFPLCVAQLRISHMSWMCHFKPLRHMSRSAARWTWAYSSSLVLSVCISKEPTHQIPLTPPRTYNVWLHF